MQKLNELLDRAVTAWSLYALYRAMGWTVRNAARQAWRATK